METNDKKELAKEALKALDEISETLKVENLVKNNQIEFEVEGVKYHIRKPTYSEITTTEEAKRKKYIELINDDSYFFRKQWIDKYTKKDIDINALENKQKLAKHEMEAALLRLATTQEPKAIEQLKNEIIKLKDEQFTISMEITDLLSYSIEQQIQIFNLSYICYLVFEKKESEEYKRVFDNYEDFRNSELKAVQQALYFISYLIYDTEVK